jgi:hypothetical protein
MDTWVYRVSAKHLGGWSWIADFAYRWDAERFIAHRAKQEYKIDSLRSEDAAREHLRLAQSCRF